MKQRRLYKVVVYIEPLVETGMQKVISANETSASNYIRSLVIRDLKERGLLTDSMIAEHLC